MKNNGKIAAARNATICIQIEAAMHAKLKFVEMWHALWLFLRDNFIINGWLEFSIADVCQLF